MFANRERARGIGDRRLAPWRVAAPAHVRVDQRRLVAPLNLAAFGLGARRDRRIFFVDPLLHGLRSLLVGALDRLLRREAPAFEIIADGAHLELDAALALDQFADRGAGPQREVHLQLLRPLVADQLANTRFLIGREAAAIAGLLAT